jgi:hypothetical protein
LNLLPFLERPGPTIYWGHTHAVSKLDNTPKNSNKRMALSWLCRWNRGN